MINSDRQFLNTRLGTTVLWSSWDRMQELIYAFCSTGQGCQVGLFQAKYQKSGLVSSWPKKNIWTFGFFGRFTQKDSSENITIPFFRQHIFKLW